MKTLLLILVFTASLASAQDYYYIINGQTNGLPDGVMAINWQDRDGDRKDYRDTRLPLPNSFPCLVAASGEQTPVTGTIKQAIRTLRDTQRVAATNDLPSVFDALQLSTNTMSLIGTNRTGFGVLRYDGTKLTAGQRETYQTECIQYLAARMQLLERELRRAKMVNIKDLAEDAGQ